MWLGRNVRIHLCSINNTNFIEVWPNGEQYLRKLQSSGWSLGLVLMTDTRRESDRDRQAERVSWSVTNGCFICRSHIFQNVLLGFSKVSHCMSILLLSDQWNNFSFHLTKRDKIFFICHAFTSNVNFHYFLEPLEFAKLHKSRR